MKRRLKFGDNALPAASVLGGDLRIRKILMGQNQLCGITLKTQFDRDQCGRTQTAKNL